jgi:TonB family protein
MNAYQYIWHIGPFFKLAWFVLPITGSAQMDTLLVNPYGSTYAPAPGGADASKVFTIVDQMPQFPGGDLAMFQYLASNVNYPEEASLAGISGVVYTSFVVQEDGSLRDITLLRGAHPALDAEALRVIGAMPPWEPGKHKSQVCCVQFNLPIRFSLGQSHQEQLKAQPPERMDPVLTRQDAPVIRDKVEVMPSFPGGEMALFKFIASNLKYPEKAQRQNAQGVVYLTFVIDETGVIRDPHVLKSPHSALSEESLRIIGLMPVWEPGMQDGIRCSVKYNLPIRFTMR